MTEPTSTSFISLPVDAPCRNAYTFTPPTNSRLPNNPFLLPQVSFEHSLDTLIGRAGYTVSERNYPLPVSRLSSVNSQFSPRCIRDFVSVIRLVSSSYLYMKFHLHPLGNLENSTSGLAGFRVILREKYKIIFLLGSRLTGGCVQ